MSVRGCVCLSRVCLSVMVKNFAVIIRWVCAGRGLPAVGSAVSARGVRLPVVRLFCPLWSKTLL